MVQPGEVPARFTAAGEAAPNSRDNASQRAVAGGGTEPVPAASAAFERMIRRQGQRDLDLRCQTLPPGRSELRVAADAAPVRGGGRDHAKPSDHSTD